MGTVPDGWHCNWSVGLGPKLKKTTTSRRRVSTVTKGRLNPNSRHHRSFNLGFPNRYDRSLGRTVFSDGARRVFIDRVLCSA